MKNVAYACNVGNGTIHNGNVPVEIEQTMLLATTKENIATVEVGTFAHPKQIKKRKIVEIVEETNFLDPNERICYTLRHADMNLMKIERNRIYVAEMVKPKAKRLRRKKCAKRNTQVANVWEDLCFCEDIQPKYDCNVKPQDYVQFLLGNNPIRDPMFCQFDITNDIKSNCSAEPFCEYDEYGPSSHVVSDWCDLYDERERNKGSLDLCFKIGFARSSQTDKSKNRPTEIMDERLESDDAFADA